MEDNRTVVEVDAPPEAPLPGSSWSGVALFPFFAVAGLALGLTYGMPWLITSSLAISLALLAVVGSTFVNRRGRAGVLRLDLHGDGVRIGPGPLARWLPITAGALALVAILVDIGLRIGGFFAEESGGLTFSLMIAAVIGWGLFDGYQSLSRFLCKWSVLDGLGESFGVAQREFVEGFGPALDGGAFDEFGGSSYLSVGS